MEALSHRAQMSESELRRPARATCFLSDAETIVARPRKDGGLTLH